MYWFYNYVFYTVIYRRKTVSILREAVGSIKQYQAWNFGQYFSVLLKIIGNTKIKLQKNVNS